MTINICSADSHASFFTSFGHIFIKFVYNGCSLVQAIISLTPISSMFVEKKVLPDIYKTNTFYFRIPKYDNNFIACICNKRHPVAISHI